MFQGPKKKGVLQLEGVLQIGGNTVHGEDCTYVAGHFKLKMSSFIITRIFDRTSSKILCTIFIIEPDPP